MQPNPQNDRAPAAANGRGAKNASLGRLRRDHTAKYHVEHASVDVLLQRLDGVMKSGNGWRARCPACGGTSRKLSIAETADRLLVHCFGCGDANAVLTAVGLAWADLHPPRAWPQSVEEQRRARRAIKECGWASALSVLSLEARILLLAARELHYTGCIAVEDGKRLAEAVKRVESAADVLTDPTPWRPTQVRA